MKLNIEVDIWPISQTFLSTIEMLREFGSHLNKLEPRQVASTESFQLRHNHVT
jgi:hypothetical protein